MTAIEFESIVTEAGQLALPPDIVSRIPAGEHIRVFLMWENESSDVAWRTQGRALFEAAYAPEDSIYEQLIDDAPVR